MNSAEAFMKEGILVDPSISEDLKEMKAPLVGIIKNLDISFLSRREFEEHYDKIKLILENLMGAKKGDEREDIEQTVNYIRKFASSSGQVQILEKKPEIKKNIYKKSDFEKRKIKVLKCLHSIPRELTVQDFVEHYKARYNSIKNILKEHSELKNLTLINKLSQNNRDISVIGIIIDKRITKNKNIIYEIEDLTGKVRVLVNANKKELIQKSSEILLDEVVGFRCSGSSEMLFVNDIVFPDINTLVTNKKRLDEEIYAVFTSDTHAGSNVFLEKNFQKFIDWINGKTGTQEQKEQAKKIKYMFITGDIADGIGHFSGQETHLALTDFNKQYEKIAEFLSQVRRDITIIICPGQHDASYVAEPQPPIEEYAESLTKLENVIMVSNPAMLELGAKPGKEGIKVLMYHGASMHPVRNDIEELRLGDSKKHPTQIMKFLLKKRHLGPPHTTNTNLPTPEADHLVIDEVPDIFVTGDMHRTDVSNYKGVLMINSSCWQPMTPFEEKVGNIPDPCKVPLVNLKNWEVKILDFN